MWSALAARPARGRELAGWFVVLLGAGSLQLPALGRMEMHGVGIMQLEMVRTSPKAAQLTSALGPDGLSAARQQLYVDFGLLVLYGIVLSAACVLLAQRAQRRNAMGIAKAGPLFAALAVIAAACDALENVALLAVTFGHTAQPWPALASGFASMKFALLTVVLAYLVVGVAVTTVDRSAAPIGVDGDS